MLRTDAGDRVESRRLVRRLLQKFRQEMMGITAKVVRNVHALNISSR